MSLPSSGLIDFSDVRVETSQSAFTSYAFSGWAGGRNSGCVGAGPNTTYSPVNLVSSGSRYTVDGVYGVAISMSQWYSYNHAAAISTAVTGNLYLHVAPYIYTFGCHVSSMIPVDVGTSNTTLSLNISGSALYDDGSAGCWMIFYGKPWQVNGDASNALSNCGGFVYSSGAELIASGSISGSSTNRTITYNYNYDINKGQYIYYVINRVNFGCSCDPSQC